MILRILLSLLVVIGSLQKIEACTAFVVYRNGMALAGNNEDFWVTDTKIWFVPKDGSKRGEKGRFGRIYFGFSNFYPQGGMNEAGLFFDGFATQANAVKHSKERPHYQGNLADHVMANCSTVDEVIELFQKHNLEFLTNAMLMFSDQHGDSVIIEGDEFMRIKGDHQVVTNFYQSQWSKGPCPCNRFKTAKDTLEKGEPISIEVCRDILAGTRQNGRARTQYSNVYDLKNRVVYLYHFYDFDNVVSIDLAEELKKGAHEIDLPTLFPENEEFVAFREARKQQQLDRIAARRDSDIDPATFKQFTGVYELEVGGPTKPKLQVFVEKNKIFIKSVNGGDRQEIFAEGDGRFFYVEDAGLWSLHFKRGDNEEVHGLKLTLEDLGRSYDGIRVE